MNTAVLVLLRCLIVKGYFRRAAPLLRRRRKPQEKSRAGKKPEWAVREVIRFKALMPQAGCRHIADSFNRCHAAEGTRVAEWLRRHQYEVREMRRRMRRRKPGIGKRNAVWGIDVTGKQTDSGKPVSILGLLDHGSRKVPTLTALPDKCAWTLLGYMCLAVGRFGKPRFVRTDNEAVFTSRTFRFGLRLLRIGQQKMEVHCPWQNGRIERFFGTLKEKLNECAFADGETLRDFLQAFAFWYNAVRPHRALGGLTPAEVWSGKNPLTEKPESIRFFTAWEGCFRSKAEGMNRGFLQPPRYPDGLSGRRTGYLGNFSESRIYAINYK